MKKLQSVLLLTACIGLCAGSTALAEGFQDYNDYPNADGTYSYYFDCGLKVTMSEEWYQNTFVLADVGYASFYHKDSYYRYDEEGIENGGKLFSIGCSVNQDFQQIPDVIYLGFDGEEMLNYYMYKASDYGAYASDSNIKQEYDSLWAGVDDVMESVALVGDAFQTAEPAGKAEEPTVKEGSDQGAIVENDLFSFECAGDWYVSITDTVIKTFKEDPDDLPGFLAAEISITGSVEEEVENWKTLYMDKFQQRLCQEPELVSYETEGGRYMLGLRMNVSSEDGMDNVTRIVLLEEQDGRYIQYSCAYISQTYAEDRYEDETTYFEFIHAIDTFKLKG